MSKNANRTGKWTSIVRIIFMVLFFAFLFSQADAAMRNTYYMGVYQTCIQSVAVNGKYTQFDVRVCQGFEQDARRDHWFEHRFEYSMVGIQ
jgi:hypothetical protein